MEPRQVVIRFDDPSIKSFSKSNFSSDDYHRTCYTIEYKNGNKTELCKSGTVEDVVKFKMDCESKIPLNKPISDENVKTVSPATDLVIGKREFQ